MSKVSNVLLMLQYLENGRKYSIKELSEKLEVSERMVRVYKEDLEKAGIYVDTIKGPYGGYVLNQSIRIPTRKFLLKDYELKFFNIAPVRERILSDFKVGDRLITSEVKEMLRLIYQDFKYGKTPKATDLEEYFELKDIRLKDSSGKVVRGIEIVRIK